MCRAQMWESKDPDSKTDPAVTRRVALSKDGTPWGLGLLICKM